MNFLGAITVRRVGLLSYWATFTILMARAARSPGFVANPELQPYPWRTVLILALGFALVTLWLARWWNRRFQGRVIRIGEALLFVGVLLLLVLQGLGTDFPGYIYGAAWFGVGTTVLLILRLLISHMRRVT